MQNLIGEIKSSLKDCRKPVVVVELAQKYWHSPSGAAELVLNS
jgi:hypothetical protein